MKTGLSLKFKQNLSSKVICSSTFDLIAVARATVGGALTVNCPNWFTDIFHSGNCYFVLFFFLMQALFPTLDFFLCMTVISLFHFYHDINYLYEHVKVISSDFFKLPEILISEESSYFSQYPWWMLQL